MRFRNTSQLPIPKRLWRELARPLGLTAALPGAEEDQQGMYGVAKTLRVTVRSEREVREGVVVETGSYTYGHITLAPCTHCTPAFLTEVLLHELAHAWVHQHRPTEYDQSDWCDLAERFAQVGYRALGGEWRVRRRCGTYRLAPSGALRRLPAFEVVAHSLTHASQLKGWRPPSSRRGDLKANTAFSRRPPAAADADR